VLPKNSVLVTLSGVQILWYCAVGQVTMQRGITLGKPQRKACHTWVDIGYYGLEEVIGNE
jgi:hypothetical protein